MNQPHYFRVKQLWKLIDRILHLKNCQVSGVNYIPNSNEICLGKDHKLHLIFQSVYNNDIDHDFGTVLPKIELSNYDMTFVIPHGYAVYDCNLVICSDRTQELNIKINRLDYGNTEDKSNCYWRYVYPVKSDEWFLKICSQTYIDDTGTHVGFSYLKPILGNGDMHVFITRRKEEYYMIIQSGSMIDSDEMFKRVVSVTTALGLVTGYKYGDYHFQIKSDDKDFCSVKSISFGNIEETKHCNYRIVNNRWVDAYDMLGRYDYQKYAQKMLASSIHDPNLYYDDNPMEADAFNGLVNLCYNNNNMLIAASMLLEGSVLNILYQPSFYHVALESITSAIMSDNNNDAQPPMPNDYYSKKVSPILLAALNKIENLPSDAKRIYTNRITNNLNNCTNQDKLTASFNKYGYKLTQWDLEAIKKRNSTFHGHLSNVNKELFDQQWDLFAVALRLHKLCCILLLKAAGYNGKILNNEVIYGVEDACKRKEPPYITI